MIFNLVSKKFERNDTSFCQLTHLQYFLLISIVGNPKKDLSNVDREILYEKSTYIFSKVIINNFFLVQYMQCIMELIFLKKRLILSSYIPGIISLIYPKGHDEEFFYEKRVN